MAVLFDMFRSTVCFWGMAQYVILKWVELKVLGHNTGGMAENYKCGISI